MDPQKLVRAKVGLILTQPFFATLLARKKFVEDTSVNTAVINGRVIRYNPVYYDGLSSEELKGSLCHTIMHTALLHHTRRDGRDPKLWNKACDYAINPIIEKSGLALPKDALFDSQYDNMAAEDIYRALSLQEKPDPDGKPKGADDDGDGKNESDDPGGCGGVEDAPTDEKSIAQQEAETKQEIAQAMQVGKQAGKLPGGLEAIMEILQPRVPWKEVLARFLTEAARNDYSFSRPNKRYLHTGFVLPSLYNLEVGEIVLIGDTSISMDKEALDRVGTEIHEVASQFNAHMTCLWVDTKLQGVQYIEPDEEMKLEPKGRGGTDFRPGFEWLEEQGIVPKSLIYFTDGESESFPKEPDYPVLWAITGGHKFIPPFGETIKID